MRKYRPRPVSLQHRLFLVRPIIDVFVILRQITDRKLLYGIASLHVSGIGLVFGIT